VLTGELLFEAGFTAPVKANDHCEDESATPIAFANIIHRSIKMFLNPQVLRTGQGTEVLFSVNELSSQRARNWSALPLFLRHCWQYLKAAATEHFPGAAESRHKRLPDPHADS
jgi:hypothetical protein